MNHEDEIRRAWQLKKRQGYKVMPEEQLEKLLKNAHVSKVPMSSMLAAFQSTNFDADTDIEDARNELANLNGHQVSAESMVLGGIWGRAVSSPAAASDPHPELSTAAIHQRRVHNQHAWADNDTFSESSYAKLGEAFEVAKQRTGETHDDFTAPVEMSDDEPIFLRFLASVE